MARLTSTSFAWMEWCTEIFSSQALVSSTSVENGDDGLFVLLESEGRSEGWLLFIVAEPDGNSLDAGNPDFSVDFGDIKPKALVFVAAAVMLILGKPLTGTKPFGNLAYSMPKLGSDISGKVCFHLTEHEGLLSNDMLVPPVIYFAAYHKSTPGSA